MRAMGKELKGLLEGSDKEGTLLVSSRRSVARTLSREVARGRFVSPIRGAFADKTTWESLSAIERHLRCMRTLSNRHPNWVFAGFSAALVHGLSVSYSNLKEVQVASFTHATHAPSRGIRRLVIDGDEPVTIGGIQVTSLARTVYDCLRLTDFRRGLALADSALRVGGLSNDQLLEALNGHSSRIAGHDRALQTARHADPRSESGGESIARAAMIELGYQLPDLQVWIPDKLGEAPPARVDFLWRLPQRTVAGELDGREKYVNPEMTNGRDAVDVLRDERLRESRLSAWNIQVMRFSFKDVCNDARFCKILDSFEIPRVSA